MRAIQARLSRQSVTDILQGLKEKLLAGANFDPLLLFRRFEGQAGGPGSDLRNFLKQQVASSPQEVDIYVTVTAKAGL
jgi:hypothetical protein